MAQKLKKEIGTFGLLLTSVAGIIGSGWLFGAFHAAGNSGTYSIIAWIIGGFAMLFIALCFAELSTMFPKSGALVHMSHLTHGQFLGRIWSWVLFLAYVSIPPVEVIAVITYASKYLPELIHQKTGLLSFKGLIVSIIILAIIILLNFLAVKWVVKINSYVTIWKIFIPIITIVVLCVYSFHPENLIYASNGFSISDALPTIATAGIAFSFIGFRMAIDLAGESSNPKKQIPIALIGSLGIALFIYVGLQFAFIVSIPNGETINWKNLSFISVSAPLATLSALIGATWWSIMLYADAFVSPLGSSYICVTSSSRITMASGEISYLPKFLTDLNRYGAPWKSLIVTFLFGCLFFLPFPSWQQMVSYVTSVILLSFGLGPIILIILRKKLPERERPFKLKWAGIIAPIAFFITNCIIIWSGYKTISFMLNIIIFFLVICIIQIVFSKSKTLKRKDFIGVLWLAPYFIGLFIISKYGPNVLDGSGMFGFWTTILWTLVLSIIILFFAVKSSQNSEEIKLAANEIDQLQV